MTFLARGHPKLLALDLLPGALALPQLQGVKLEWKRKDWLTKTVTKRCHLNMPRMSRGCPVLSCFSLHWCWIPAISARSCMALLCFYTSPPYSKLDMWCSRVVKQFTGTCNIIGIGNLNLTCMYLLLLRLEGGVPRQNYTLPRLINYVLLSMGDHQRFLMYSFGTILAWTNSEVRIL